MQPPIGCARFHLRVNIREAEHVNQLSKGVRRKRCGSGLLLLALIAPVLMGMGGGNSGAEKPIPIPQRNFTVSITDMRGRKATAERFTWEGKVHFQGQYGSATITVPFQKVQSVQVLPTQENVSPTQILTRMNLRSGETLELALDRTSKCYGETPFGNYEIFVKDIGEIQFQ